MTSPKVLRAALVVLEVFSSKTIILLPKRSEYVKIGEGRKENRAWTSLNFTKVYDAQLRDFQLY